MIFRLYDKEISSGDEFVERATNCDVSIVMKPEAIEVIITQMDEPFSSLHGSDDGFSFSQDVDQIFGHFIHQERCDRLIEPSISKKYPIPCSSTKRQRNNLPSYRKILFS